MVGDHNLEQNLNRFTEKDPQVNKSKSFIRERRSIYAVFIATQLNKTVGIELIKEEALFRPESVGFQSALLLDASCRRKDLTTLEKAAFKVGSFLFD